MKAIVLLSGGLDSATCLAVARDPATRVNGPREIYALSFDYGQRHSVELDRARVLARDAGVVEHRVVTIDFPAGASALTDHSIPVPKLPTEGIPPTYVPGRNTIFLAFALSWAEVIGAREIWIGVNAVDYSGYPDCRPGYISAFQELADQATKETPPVIVTPLLFYSKADIIKKGLNLGVDYSKTSSCYDPSSDGACGACDSCRIRRAGFADAGVPDPTVYR